MDNYRFHLYVIYLKFIMQISMKVTNGNFKEKSLKLKV